MNEQDLAAEENTNLGSINNWTDLLWKAVIPHFAVVGTFIVGALLAEKYPKLMIGATSGGFVMLFICFWAFVFSPLGRRYETRVTVPLWYGLIVWGILASVPFFAVMIIARGANTLADAVMLLLAIFSVLMLYYAIPKRKANIQSSQFVVFDFPHFIKTIAVFYLNIFLAIAEGVSWLFLAIGSCVVLLLVKVLTTEKSLSNSTLCQSSRMQEEGAIKILHLSDLHLRNPNQSSIEDGKRPDLQKHEKLIEFLEGESDYSLIVITGDITDAGSQTDFEVASTFLSQLRATAKQIPIFIVPGNHDLALDSCCWSISYDASSKVRWHKALRFLASALGGFVGPFKDSYTARLSRFNMLVKTHSHQQTGCASRLNLFNFPELKLSVMTLNTTQSGKWIGANARGRFSRTDMQDMESFEPLLEERLLILCHHHLRDAEENDIFLNKLGAANAAFMRASNSTLLAETLSKKLGRSPLNTLILHGHTHIYRDYKLPPTSGESPGIPVLCGPSLFEGSAPGFLIHNWGANAKITTNLKKWCRKKKQYVSKCETCPENSIKCQMGASSQRAITN